MVDRFELNNTPSVNSLESFGFVTSLSLEESAERLERAPGRTLDFHLAIRCEARPPGARFVIEVTEERQFMRLAYGTRPIIIEARGSLQSLASGTRVRAEFIYRDRIGELVILCGLGASFCFVPGLILLFSGVIAMAFVFFGLGLSLAGLGAYIYEFVKRTKVKMELLIEWFYRLLYVPPQDPN